MAGLIFTPEVFILMQKRGPGGAMNVGVTWKLVKEQLLHNFMKFFSGPKQIK